MRENIAGIRPHSDDDYVHAAHLMERFGGSFASCIAQAYYAADSHNRARLRVAFPDLFTRYFNLYINQEKEQQ